MIMVFKYNPCNGCKNGSHEIGTIEDCNLIETKNGSIVIPPNTVFFKVFHDGHVFLYFKLVNEPEEIIVGSLESFADFWSRHKVTYVDDNAQIP
jgi:hypothetical protein